MDASRQGDELIDVVVRLPRKALEDSLLAGPALAEEPGQRRLGAAKALLAGRRRRSTCFGSVRFYDPAWDMILELFVATGERRALSVSQLCGLSGGSMTTALRHIEHLEALGFIGRAADPDDKRRILVTMLTPLVEACERWLDLRVAGSHLRI